VPSAEARQRGEEVVLQEQGADENALSKNRQKSCFETEDAGKGGAGGVLRKRQTTRPASFFFSLLGGKHSI